MQIPCDAAAADVATSPSGCANLCIAEGLNPSGKGTLDTCQTNFPAYNRQEKSRLAIISP